MRHDGANTERMPSSVDKKNVNTAKCKALLVCLNVSFTQNRGRASASRYGSKLLLYSCLATRIYRAVVVLAQGLRKCRAVTGTGEKCFVRAPFYSLVAAPGSHVGNACTRWICGRVFWWQGKHCRTRGCSATPPSGSVVGHLSKLCVHPRQEDCERL